MERLITTNERLASVCAQLAQEPYITIDTEFVREKTYYPKLCLVQLAGVNHEVAIDPLADGIDLTPLFDLLQNPSVLKVFHACKQDIEIFYQLTGKVPNPLYDTQVAAMVCGFGEQVGYEALVNTLVNETLDKGSRYTDWEQRPLTQRQLDYAIADVTHLRHVYESLSERIASQHRESWIAEEMATMQAAESYMVNPDEVWRKLKYKNRSPVYLNALRAITAWRERTAQRKDVPRGRLIKDDIILQIASLDPSSIEELNQVRGVMKHMSNDTARSLVEALNEARTLPREQWPQDAKKKKMLKADQEVLVDVLRLLLKLLCEQAHVASKLVANKEDLSALVLGKDLEDVPCTHGWRYDVFGKVAQEFLSGKVHLSASLDGYGIRFMNSNNEQVA